MSLLNVKQITNGIDTASTRQIARGSSRAKANFSHVGVVRDDLNVSSITDAGESVYRVNFAEQLTAPNYCVSIVANSESDQLQSNTVGSVAYRTDFFKFELSEQMRDNKNYQNFINVVIV
jgi:hypothetical protein